MTVGRTEVRERHRPASRKPAPCTCPHGERPLGRLHGVDMGRGVLRLSTTPGCPEHDTCHGWTAKARAAHGERWGKLQCPIHHGRNCP